MYNHRAMNVSLPIQHNYSLRALNSFGIESTARAYLKVTATDQLETVRQDAALSTLPRLILGGGNNLLLTRDFPGLVLHLSLRGISFNGEDDDFTYVRAAAGEDWQAFVLWSLENNLAGLENLSLIPGTVGAAPVQNIGAYGAELKDVFHSLTVFDFESGKIVSFSKADCDFGYRDSIFKHALRDRFVILDVTFALPKHWQANTAYADVANELAQRKIAEPTPRDISDVIIAIRQRKLPDPAQIGNAGSFFKNPVVTTETRDALVRQHPKLVSYPHGENTHRLAAGWLIDQCGWKGKTIGNAGVYETQALVLVNRGGANGREIAELAKKIQADVTEKFGIQLEPEPVII